KRYFVCRQNRPRRHVQTVGALFDRRIALLALDMACIQAHRLHREALQHELCPEKTQNDICRSIEAVGEKMIKIKGLKKSFGDLEVLKGIDLEIKEREVVCIIGASGSGKSTLLRCINLLEEPTDGEVYIEDVKVNDPKTDINKIRTDVGMVFQQFNLFPHMTVLDNITIAPRKVKKVDEKEAEALAYELL